MTTKGAFVDSLKAENLSDLQIVQEMKKYRAKNGSFDDEEQKATPVQSQRKPRRFFGLSEDKEKILFPRAVETRKRGGGPFRTAIPGAMDVISMAGRTVASIPAGIVPGGEDFGESFKRKEALPKEGLGKIGQFVGNVVRDPLTYLTLGTGVASAPSKVAGSSLLKKVGQFAGKGASEQVVPAFSRQLEKSSREGKIDLPQQTKEALSEVGFGAVGGAMGAAFPIATSKFGKRLMRGVQKTKDKTAKLAGHNVEKGVQNIVNDIVEFNLESPIGNFEKMAIKANKRIGVESGKLDDIIDKFSDDNPNITVDIDDLFKTYIEDIKAGKIDNFWGDKAEESASEYAEEILSGLKKRGLSGSQPVSSLRSIKQALRKSLKLFKKGKFAISEDPIKSQVGDLAELRIAQHMNKYIPEAKKLNDNMRRLYTTRDALNEASKRSTNNNFLSLRQGIAGALGLAAGMPTETIASLVALKALQEGRGPSTLIKLGRFGQKNIDEFSNVGKTLAAQGVAEKGRKIKDLFQIDDEENTENPFIK